MAWVARVFFVVMTCASMLLAQSRVRVIVRDVHPQGDLGLVSLSELQEYTAFLVGHSDKASRVLDQCRQAITEGLRHRGYLKAHATASFEEAPHSEVTPSIVVLDVEVHAGEQYRIKEFRFSGLASEFRPADLRAAIPMNEGEIADSEQIGVSIGRLGKLFQRAGKSYTTIPTFTFDDDAGTVVLSFDVVK
jgi:outer membrane protein assembly factor BamA